MALDFVPQIGDVVMDGLGDLLDITSTCASWDFPIKARKRGKSYDSSFTKEGRYYAFNDSIEDIVKLYKRKIPEETKNLDSRDYFVKVMGGIL